MDDGDDAALVDDVLDAPSEAAAQQELPPREPQQQLSAVHVQAAMSRRGLVSRPDAVEAVLRVLRREVDPAASLSVILDAVGAHLERDQGRGAGGGAGGGMRGERGGVRAWAGVCRPGAAQLRACSKQPAQMKCAESGPPKCAALALLQRAPPQHASPPFPPRLPPAGPAIVDAALIASVAAASTRNEDDATREAIEVVSSFALHKWRYDVSRRAFYHAGNSFRLHADAGARIALLDERLGLAYGRCSRNESFRPPPPGVKRSFVQMHHVEDLPGIMATAAGEAKKSSNTTLIGLLTQPEDGLWCLEDGAWRRVGGRKGGGGGSVGRNRTRPLTCSSSFRPPLPVTGMGRQRIDGHQTKRCLHSTCALPWTKGEAFPTPPSPPLPRRPLCCVAICPGRGVHPGVLHRDLSCVRGGHVPPRRCIGSGQRRCRGCASRRDHCRGGAHRGAHAGRVLRAHDGPTAP